MNSTPTQKREQLSHLLARAECVFAGSVFDPVSARVADLAGIEVGLLGGSLASLAVLGAPDIMLLTQSELTEQARRICRVSELPVVVDADNGYGNALNVIRGVEELASAGVAGISLEDTQLPQSFGNPGQSLVSLEEAVGKFRAAVKAARTSGMLVFGRTNALPVTGLDDAVRRLQAYESTGISALFVPYLSSREQLERIASGTTLPIILGGPSPEVIDPEFLDRCRVRICLIGHHALPAAVHAFYEVACAVRKGLQPPYGVDLATERFMALVSRHSEYQGHVESFMRTHPTAETQV